MVVVSDNTSTGSHDEGSPLTLKTAQARVLLMQTRRRRDGDEVDAITLIVLITLENGTASGAAPLISPRLASSSQGLTSWLAGWLVLIYYVFSFSLFEC